MNQTTQYFFQDILIIRDNYDLKFKGLQKIHRLKRPQIFLLTLLQDKIWNCRRILSIKPWNLQLRTSIRGKNEHRK